ncbi:Ribonuclease H2 subunit C [Lasiodiplodia theobromae]|nr:Ribonuclease H2 subunit C [Lasiodiplodia theobromae]
MLPSGIGDPRRKTMANKQPIFAVVNFAVANSNSPTDTEVRRKSYNCMSVEADANTGSVLSSTNKVLPQSEGDRGTEAEEDEEDERIEVRLMEEVGEFDEVVVWGHEVVPDETEDAYSKGISEWISFAEAIHATPESEDAPHASK